MTTRYYRLSLLLIVTVFLSACQSFHQVENEPIKNDTQMKWKTFSQKLFTEYSDQETVFIRKSTSTSSITARLAINSKTRAQGLMGVRALEENHGMLFVFPHERPLSFWMKNTLIPLDIIYLDSKGVIQDVQTMHPCPAETKTCPSYPSLTPSQYALEISAGRAKELQLSPGDTLFISQ